jgi:prepilin-type N-terminal cleavage/methylation domain-containing protein
MKRRSKRAEERRWARAGFTLLEMLVATTVLLFLIALLAEITNGAAAVVHSTRLMDADIESRLVFNRMGLDFASMLKRPDVDYSTFKQPTSTLPAQYGNVSQPANLQPGNDECAFYTGGAGYFSGTQPTGQEKAPVALVAYMVANDSTTGTPGLQRMAKGLGWEPDAGGAWQNIAYLPSMLTAGYPELFSSDPDYQALGYQVFRIEYNYLLKPSATTAAQLSITPWNVPLAHTSINGFADVAAIVVTIAVLDGTSREIVSNYSNLTSCLPDAKDNQGVASSWNGIVNSPTFATTAGIPAAAAKAVRVYERYFYLDTIQESVP